MGSDGCEAGAGESGRISIHAPRMGSDDCPLDAILISMRFQSTLPGWGATLRRCNPLCRARDFNPRSPDGERPNRATDNSQRSIFQSTLPGWGATAVRVHHGAVDVFQSTLPGWGATTRPPTIIRRTRFQSTLPGWGATYMFTIPCVIHEISIHAPRMGSDWPSSLR